MADLFKHFADLAIASFTQCDFEPGIIRLFDHAYLCRSCAYPAARIALLGDRNAGTQAAKLIFGRLPGYFHQIGLWNMRSRLHQLVSQPTVIG
jgi:hypothetical protein